MADDKNCWSSWIIKNFRFVWAIAPELVYMCFATVFDVLSSFIQSLSLLSYVAYGPRDILIFLKCLL